MVNTFLVDKDFRVSASKLDRQRLGKQRVEAQQILSILEKLTFLADFFSIEKINRIASKEDRTKWVKHVVSTYKNSGIKAILLRGNLIILYLNNLPRKIKSKNRLFFDNDGMAYEVNGNKIISSDKWENYILPGETLITTGFMNHPAVIMWLGYEEALKDYINAHIEVWISRGYNNTMATYSVSSKYDRPPWTYSDSVIADFRASLLHREIERREPAWYMRQDDFISSWTKFISEFKLIVDRLPINWYLYVEVRYLLLFGSDRGLPWS